MGGYFPASNGLARANKAVAGRPVARPLAMGLSRRPEPPGAPRGGAGAALGQPLPWVCQGSRLERRCGCERVWKKPTRLVALTQQLGSTAHEQAVEAELSSRREALPKAASPSSRSTSLRMSFPATCAPCWWEGARWERGLCAGRAGHVLGMCVACASHVHGNCRTSVWHMHGTCTAHARHMHHMCTCTAHVPYVHMRMHVHIPGRRAAAAGAPCWRGRAARRRRPWAAARRRGRRTAAHSCGGG